MISVNSVHMGCPIFFGATLYNKTDAWNNTTNAHNEELMTKLKSI